MMKKLLFAIFFVAAGFSYAQKQVNWSDLQANIDEWAKGPVSLLMTDDERQVFAKLKSAEDKMQFIKIFWGRRDPILRTRTNEFKEEFYKRVDYANENFAEREAPGWKSARGQVYVVFGAPSRIDHHSVEDSSRPALLWVYDKLPSRIPRNEALMFVWREIKYVLVPPNPDPGDVMGARQASMDRSFRYETIPTLVDQAFADVSKTNIVDEKKDYDELLYSVRSTEKFGIAQITFDATVQAKDLVISIPVDSAPVYDEGNRTFAEIIFIQELKQGDKVIARSEHTESYTWNAKSFDNLQKIEVKLPVVQAPAGSYELHLTVQDRISGVGETKKIAVNL